MRTPSRRSRWAIVVAATAWFVLLLLPWEYCMAGNGYGFPFAWYHPNHGGAGEIAATALPAAEPPE